MPVVLAENAYTLSTVVVPLAGRFMYGQLADAVDVVCEPLESAMRNSFAPEEPERAIVVPVQSGLASVPRLKSVVIVVMSAKFIPLSYLY